MKRLIDYDLREWKAQKKRKPLLLRGARQVGKTHAVRVLGQSFEHFIEVNFEEDPGVAKLFEQDLKAERLTRDLALYFDKPIEPEKTLLFLDEIQGTPRALIALRYFYEAMPDLHVIAAGSLIDFAIQQVGMPVGRIASIYLYPLSFVEFLAATGASGLAEEITNHSAEEPLQPALHHKLLILLSEYMVIGGMPEAVKCWRDTKKPEECFQVHQSLLDAYRQDFHKYARKLQIKYLERLFGESPRQLGKRFKYAQIGEGYRKREVDPCLDLLVTAGVLHRVTHTAGNGIPLGAEVRFEIFKILFLDVGLAQSLLGLNPKDFFLQPEQTLINKGEVTEAFVGQELLAYASPYRKAALYYWHRQAKGNAAEVDYLHQSGEKILPCEVKSGKGTSLRSLRRFLEDHPNSPYGIRFSTQNYSIHDGVHSYPLYAVIRMARWDSEARWEALFSTKKSF